MSGVKKKGLDFEKGVDNFLSVYANFVYKYFGRKLLKGKKFKTFFYKNVYNKKYEKILREANLRILPEEYFVTVYITIVLSLLLFLFLSVFFYFISLIWSIFFFYGGIFFVAILGIFLYNYPLVVSNERGKEIDAAIPYLLPYMKILSKELSLSKIVVLIDDFLIYKEIKKEFQKINYYLNFLGYDIHSSIREAMQSCPSRQLSDLMNDLVTISNSGGDIYGYLDRKLSNLNEEIDAVEKKSLDTLLIFSQIYVVLLLISPLFFTIMTSILDLISSTASSAEAGVSLGSTTTTIFGLLFALPFLYAGFMMLIYYSKPLYSRLKPIVEK